MSCQYSFFLSAKMIKSCASEIVSSDVQFARVNLHKAAFISLVSNQFSRVLELVFILLSILSSCKLPPLLYTGPKYPNPTTVYWAQTPQSNYCILATGPKYPNPTTVYWAQIPQSSRMRPDLSDELFSCSPERRVNLLVRKLVYRGQSGSFETFKVETSFIWVTTPLYYRSGTVNSKSFVGKVLLRIKWKFELN